MDRHQDDLELIFRRYRTLPDGTVLDARKYGLKAWPLWVPRKAK
jgi:hypothetical protein